MASKTQDYRFIDKDPIIDVMRTAWQDSGLTLNYISQKSGIGISTMYRWFNGKAKRPQHVTVKFFLAACGVKLVAVRADGSVVRGTAVHMAKAA